MTERKLIVGDFCLSAGVVPCHAPGSGCQDAVARVGSPAPVGADKIPDFYAGRLDHHIEGIDNILIGKYAGSYTDQQLSTDANAIIKYLASGRSVYVYFNNDVKGHAVRNAKRLKELTASRLRASNKMSQ